MEKIIELICEEARRRPGKDLVSNLYHVSLEVRMLVMELMEQLRKAEKASVVPKPLEKENLNDSEIKLP